jgi:hypothetical protein
LLDTNTRVIIPDFGAFIIKQKDPRLIVFNEFLRYNDGLLIEFVAKSENIDKVVAKKKVMEYVDLASKNLKDNSEHLIEGMGKLIKESTGKITFEEILGAAGKESKKKESKKVTEIKEEKKPKTEEAAPSKPIISEAEKESAKIQQEKPVEKKTAASVAKEESMKEISAKPKEEAVVKPKVEPVVKAGAETAAKPKVEPVPKAGEETAAKPKVEPVPKPKPPYQTAEIRRKKKSNSQIVIWIILILIINAAIISWFLFNDEIRGLFKKQSGETVILEEETTDQDTEIKEKMKNMPVSGEANIEEPATDIHKQNIKEPEIAPEIEEEPVSYSEVRYYVVAGCFRDEKNATALVKKLIKKGYNAEKFGKIGNLHAVSYSSFTDRNEAQSYLKKIRDEEEADAWIYY